MNEDRLKELGRYVIVSPVKNESQYIAMTVESIIRQTVKPVSWVIVDDGSNDGTSDIVRKYAKEHDWIRLVCRPDSGVTRRRGKGVIEAFYAGYETIVEDYEFIAKIDGDVTVDPDYFEAIIAEFAADSRLGIAGGAVYEQPDGNTWARSAVRDSVRGCTKIYRRLCFKEIGGLATSMGWDGLDEWTALSLGWKVRSFVEHKMYHYRFTGSATGMVKSYQEQGLAAYRIGYHPLYLVARGIRCIPKKPWLIGGMAMIWAYFLALTRGDQKIASPSVNQYICAAQMKKLAGLLAGKAVHEI